MTRGEPSRTTWRRALGWHLKVHDPWIEAIQGLKGVGFLVVSAGYLLFELLHLRSVHFGGAEEGKNASRTS